MQHLQLVRTRIESLLLQIGMVEMEPIQLQRILSLLILDQSQQELTVDGQDTPILSQQIVELSISILLEQVFTKAAT